ncbi:metacaspase type II [Volvox carteri f. nagariensis]|uniref:Metacaspase type II n=1 Tax=Volvox carteri f. nagariensis TaxID=3068 RepID=D8TJX4_VOLCA|nr:metacaspase type II [Volvox carteri f. nagariensis]EFJ51964.1 metacaspase type II [Volvox carteri f. nagariensis]|eukprot:XP_002946738.1 metacaspase type II [Volvox carteri f. nagariensis]
MPSKRAVLIGCNYPGTNAALRGCINDVWGMKAILEEFFGFGPSDITILIDTDPQYLKPTGKNMKAKISEMVAAAQDGDVCVLHFSGHGTQIPSYGGDEKDGKDEAICPTDMNVICDDDLRALLKPLEAKPGVKFTFIADCCHSGTLLDHETVQISGPKDGAPRPPQIDMGVLSSLFGTLGQPDGRDFKNRALPFNDLCGMLSELLGGAPVDARNVRSNLGTLFAGDASAKVQQFMQVFQMFTAGQKEGGGAGGVPAMGLLQLLCACLAPSADQGSGGPTGQPANANSGPGATYAVGNLNEPDLKINLPTPGTKPPGDQQLSSDVGILITGCQSHETSADACPSGNPDKAHGALSNAIQTVVRTHHQQNPGQPLTYRNLVISVRELLAKTGFAQNPCLECSDTNADTPFIMH